MLIHKYVKTLRQVEDLKDEIFRQRQEHEQQINLQQKQIAELREEYQAELQNREASCRLALRQIHEEAFFAGAISERNAVHSNPELMVQISPCIQMIPEPGLQPVKCDYECCLHYQLILKGEPCFEPHIQLMEKQVEEIGTHDWDRLLTKSREITQAAMQASLGDATYLAVLLDHVVINKLSAERQLLETITLSTSGSTFGFQRDKVLRQLAVSGSY